MNNICCFMYVYIISYFVRSGNSNKCICILHTTSNKSLIYFISVRFTNSYLTDLLTWKMTDSAGAVRDFIVKTLERDIIPRKRTMSRLKIYTAEKYNILRVRTIPRINFSIYQLQLDHQL